MKLEGDFVNSTKGHLYYTATKDSCGKRSSMNQFLNLSQSLHSGILLDEFIRLLAGRQGGLVVVANLSVSGPTWRRARVLPLNAAAQHGVREGSTDPVWYQRSTSGCHEGDARIIHITTRVMLSELRWQRITLNAFPAYTSVYLFTGICGEFMNGCIFFRRGSFSILARISNFWFAIYKLYIIRFQITHD